MANKALSMAGFVKGDKAAHQVSQSHMPCEYLGWKDIELQGLPLKTDVVVNLSGRSIGEITFWNQWFKESLRNSRLVEAS